MLMAKDERATGSSSTASSTEPHATSASARSGVAYSAGRSRLERALRIEWLGQTVASVCWIASVLSYGISSSGDWLQLCAASAWLCANIASLATAGSD